MSKTVSEGFLLFATLLGVVLLPSPAKTQATGTISGYVQDSSGASIAEASATATLVSRGTSFTAETNLECFYNFPALPPGAYSLAVEKTGFEKSVPTGIQLAVRDNLRVDATLKVGAVTQALSVTAQAPLVDTLSGTVSGLVDDRRIVDLPRTLPP
jgi:hypothetical protein